MTPLKAAITSVTLAFGRNGPLLAVGVHAGVTAA